MDYHCLLLDSGLFPISSLPSSLSLEFCKPQFIC